MNDFAENTTTYYSTHKIETEDAMRVLREIFPNGKANEYNFVLFSTSGVHGSYCTIETCEEDEEVETVTFLLIKPRIVQTLWGNCRPLSKDDFEFLKKLRESSRDVLREINTDTHA